MIVIDGSFGEGGGQVLRTALGLSLVTGKAFRIENIRAKRRKPGLMRQHLTAVNAAAEIGDAKVEGNEISATNLTFMPSNVKSGKYHFSIGSAGSCTLVLQAILPGLMMTKGRSEILIEGGTHNPMAPPFDFLNKAFLPLLNRIGVRTKISLDRHGFYPAGGGRIKVYIEPTGELKKIDLVKRGSLIGKNAKALTSHIPEKIAHRELKVIRDRLGIEKDGLQSIVVKDSQGPGNILSIEIESENITEVFTGFGERGIRAEDVADKTVKKAMEYLNTGATVGKYLADQLLIPMALSGGGKFTTITPTEHTKTNMEVIGKFLPVNISMKEIEKELWEIEIN